MKKYLGFILCGILVLTGCTKVPKLENGQDLVGEVDGKQITTQEFYEKLKGNYGTSILISMIDEHIISKELTEDMAKSAEESAKQEVKQMKAQAGSSYWETMLAQYGYDSEEALLKDIITSYKQQLVLKKYIEADVITEDDINDYYKDEIYGEISARHILIKPEVKDDMTDEEKATAKETALAKAKLLINQLSGSTDLENSFSELAKKESDDTGNASEGGLISNFTNQSNLAKEFFDASNKLEIGKMTLEPVETSFGYHIIYKVSQKEKPALDSVKNTVISALVTKTLSAENANYIYWGALREKYNLKIHDDVISSAYKSTINNIK